MVVVVGSADINAATNPKEVLVMRGTLEVAPYWVAGENADDTTVQVYSPVVKEVMDKPTDPFMSFKKVGKVWVTDKAKSPKAAAQVVARTGLYMAGRGFFVSVSASTKVCTKNQAVQLSKSIK